MNSNLRLIFLILSGLLIWNRMVYSQYVDERLLKAAFLERFTRFIEWPDRIEYAPKSHHFVMVVYGENPFGKILDDVYSRQKIKERKVDIYCTDKFQDIPENAHLIFISGSKKDELDNIIPELHKKPVLLIGDTKGYAEKGVYINFFIEDNKLRFEINEKAVQSSDLRVSYLLMNSAKIINSIHKDL